MTIRQLWSGAFLVLGSVIVLLGVLCGLLCSTVGLSVAAYQLLADSPTWIRVSVPIVWLPVSVVSLLMVLRETLK